jgi:hypothetical protein
MKTKTLFITLICSFLFIGGSISSLGYKNSATCSITINNTQYYPKYIIITSKEFKNYKGPNNDDDFHDLCDFHTSEALNCKIETIDYIDDKYDGSDLQEKIRNYTKIEKPKYVLLAGDHDLIPARYLMYNWNAIRHPSPGPSELYYSCPDVTWHKGPEEFLPWDHDLSTSDNNLHYSLSGDDLFEGDGFNTPEGEMKWVYKTGNTDQNGILNINFDQPVDLSDMNWMYFDIKTSLREYPFVDGHGNNSIGICYNSFSCSFTDSSGRTEHDNYKIRFLTELAKTSYNSNEWENFEISFKCGVCGLDYSKISKISFGIDRFYGGDSGPNPDFIPLNPGDHVLIDKIYFSDYNEKGFVKKDGELKPTVCIGRACVDSIEDINNFVGKTLTYVDTDYPEDEYLENVLLLDTHSDEYERQQSTKYLDKIKETYLDPSGYSSTKIYDNNQEARDLLFNGDKTHLLFYSGHGSENEECFLANRNNIDKFKNNNLFFEFSVGCFVGAFDSNDCYAEDLICKTPNGAFAGIWHTRDSWVLQTYTGFSTFLNAICNWDYTIGEAHSYMIQNCGGPWKYTHTLFGDPAVKIKRINPKNCPEKPSKPRGTTIGRAGKEYFYTTSTTDPQNDEVYYKFDWGDETDSGWLGPYTSGAEVTASHTWYKKGSQDIKVKAKDTSDVESPWSDPLSISMPKTKIYFNSLLLDLLSLIQRILMK